MEVIIRMQQKRLLESNKRSAFRVRKRPVPPEKINRYIKEHDKEPITTNYDSNIGRNTGLAGMIPATLILTWMNDVTHLYTRSYPRKY
jgi:hypothetical protein